MRLGSIGLSDGTQCRNEMHFDKHKEGKLTWNEKLVKSIEELAKDTGKGGSAKGGGQNKARPR